MKHKKKDMVDVIESMANCLGYKVVWFHNLKPNLIWGDVGLHQKLNALLDYLDLEIEVNSCKITKKSGGK